MNRSTTISMQENEALLKFPAYISLLAANSDSKLDDVAKRSAIKFSHLKTYTCDPLLIAFYAEADQVFEKNIDQLDEELPTDKKERKIAIHLELAKLETIVKKLGDDYAAAMTRSMKSFKDHVSKAHDNVLLNFVFPMPIKGITY